MSSVAVPKKMVPVPNVYGVESFKEIKPEMVALHPIQHKNTSFTSGGVNRISFKVPAYSNALLDTSRSFLHMHLQASAKALLAQGLPIFSRMVVKTSSGLTLEDISDMDVLSNMLSFLKPADHVNGSTYGNFVAGTGTLSSGLGQLDVTGTHEAIFKFNWGIFDKKLTKFLPLFMADGGAGYAFDVDLYVSDIGLSLGAANAVTTIVVKNPVWYLQLMRMDEGLARRFNQMAVSGEEIRIPFHTYHTHHASVQANEQLVYIHENATNFKKILTMLRTSQSTRLCAGTIGNSTDGSVDNAALQSPSGMEGGVDSDYKVTQYNYRVGVQHVYNEPVAEERTNTRTLQFVKQAFGIPDEQLTGLELVSYPTEETNADSVTTPVFQRERWMAVASFDYSPSDADVVQGISSSNPVELDIKFSGTQPVGATLLNYCELGYDLVFRGGAVHYEEQKPGSQSVY